jgi:hypothetical protein
VLPKPMLSQRAMSWKNVAIKIVGNQTNANQISIFLQQIETIQPSGILVAIVAISRQKELKNNKE